MGSGRVSSYSSRATRRTAGSGSKKRSRSRTAATFLHGRRPARGVLPLPIAHRFVVPLNASGPGIDAERAPGPLRDVAEMAEQHRLRPLLDRLAQRRAGADGVHEVRDVQGRELVVAARGERVAARLGQRFLDDLVLEIVYRVTVLVQHHAARGALDARAARAVLGREAVAGESLPDDRLLPCELEADLLSVRELPVVRKVVATADRDDARGVIHAQRPAGDVDLVRAVVADLAGAPAPEPVPVVVDDVVLIRRARRGPLPQLVVEHGGDRRRPAAPDRPPSVCVPGTGDVRQPDDALPDRLDGLDGA